MNCMPIMICDARGNGDGQICPTITGDHQDRITDYTAVVTCQETGFGWVRESDIAEFIRTPVGGGAGVANVVVYGIDCQGGKGNANFTEDVTPTLLYDSHGTPHAVAYGTDCEASRGEDQ